MADDRPDTSVKPVFLSFRYPSLVPTSLEVGAKLGGSLARIGRGRSYPHSGKIRPAQAPDIARPAVKGGNVGWRKCPPHGRPVVVPNRNSGEINGKSDTSVPVSVVPDICFAFTLGSRPSSLFSSVAIVAGYLLFLFEIVARLVATGSGFPATLSRFISARWRYRWIELPPMCLWGEVRAVGADCGLLRIGNPISKPPF